MERIYEQYEKIEDLSRYDKRDAVRDALNTEHYSPDGDIKQRINDVYNPAVEIYLREYILTKHGWKGVYGKSSVYKCPEYVPTPELIEYLSGLEGVLEIGAGNGYWSYVTKKNGGNCLPIDVRPKDVPYDCLPDDARDISPPFPELNVERPFFENCSTFPCSRQVEREDREYTEKVWDEVKFGNHKYVLHSDMKHVLLCHPVKSAWVEDLLDYLIAERKNLILVAEWGPSQDATPATFLRLDRNWELKQGYNVIDWNTMDVGAYVFEPPEESEDWQDLLK
jgi:hypothetical protein